MDENLKVDGDSTPLLNPMQPEMVYSEPPQQVHAQPTQQIIEQPQMPANNLRGGVHAVTQTTLPAGQMNPVSHESGVHTFGANVNVRAWIFFIVGIVLCVIGPLSLGITMIVGGVFIVLAIFLMKKSSVVFDDQERTISVYTSGAIISGIGESEQNTRYDEVNDFMVKTIGGMYINNQPAARVVMVLKNGSTINVSSAEMLYPAQAYAQRLKNFLAQRVR